MNSDWRHKMKQPDSVVLYLLGASLALLVMLWGFVELAEEVLEGETQRVDAYILTLLRGTDDPGVPIGPAWLLIVARDLTALGGYAVLTLFTLIAAGYTLLARRLMPTLLILAASAGGMALNSVLKWSFGRSRPDVVPHLVEVSTLSFPSGHAMLSAAVYLSIAAIAAQMVSAHQRRLYMIGVALLLSGLIGLSRVYLGVHYPTDVLAGWAAGVAWALLCWLAMIYLQYKNAP